MAIVHATLVHLKRFFQWLADKPGYKSRLQYSDAEYFNLSDNPGAPGHERPSFPRSAPDKGTGVDLKSGLAAVSRSALKK